MKKAVFIDRDGVLVEDTGFVHQINHFKLIKNVVEGLKLLKDYKLFIITNQSGIGRGYYTFQDYEKFNEYMLKELNKHKIKIEKTYLCPHKPEDNCECRKPMPKLVFDAAKEFNIDLKNSCMIGDKRIDIETGRNAGCKTILVLTGSGLIEKEHAKADYVAKDLMDAAKWVIKNDQ